MATILLLSGNVHPNHGSALTCGLQPLLKADFVLDVTIIFTPGDVPYHQLIHFLHKESQLVYQPFFPNSAHLYRQ